MANKIILKRSSVAGKSPLTTDLEIGEIALNMTDSKLFFKDASGVVKSITGSGSGTVTSVAATAGTGISITGSPITTSGTFTITNTAPNVTTNLGYTASTTNGIVTSSDGTNATIPLVVAAGNAGLMSGDDKTKLDGISGTNTGDETAITIKTKLGITTLSGSNTGDQTITLTGDVTGSGTGSFATTLANSGVTAGTYTKVTTDAKGRITSGTTLSASDIPSLDASKITSGTIDAARLPSYVDDVIEGTNLASFPATGETGKIYVALDTNKTYRWSGSAYVYITSGAVDSVAGKTGIVTLVKGDVGLGNVDNTADSAKNVLSATKLTTTRTISLTGDVTGSVSFDGSGNAAITTTVANDSHTHAFANITSKPTTLSGYGITDAQAQDADLTAIAGLTGTSGLLKKTAADTWTLDTTAYTTNTGTVTSVSGTGSYGGLTLSGTVTGSGSLTLGGTPTGSWPISVTGSSASTTGNAATATKLATARTINGVSFDGTANITVADSTKQPLDADLTAIAGLTGTSGILKKTAADTWVLDTSVDWSEIQNKPDPVITLAGDLTGSVTLTDLASGTLTATIVANSVALGTDTTGNYVAGNTAGTGIAITGTAGEGWSPTISLATVGTAGTYPKVTTDAYGRVTAGTTLSASDIPSLDASKITSGTIDSARLPSYVDDVIEGTNLAAFPATGETGKIYVALDTNKTYRWSGSAYVYITSGAVDSVAGKTGVVTLVKGDVGLGSVDNTADSAKNVLSATKLTTARTINGVSFDGTANITVADSTKVDKVTSTDNAIARYDGTGGAVQNSSVTIDDSGNVGIGTNSPTQLATLYSSTNDNVRLSTCRAGKREWSIGSKGYYWTLRDEIGSVDVITADINGNLGIGVTPSAWTLAPAFELKQSGVGIWNSGSNDLYLTNNSYYSSGWKYGTTGVTSSQYRQTSGAHSWFTAPSGTAGNAITWTSAMTLNANGNLLVGTTTDNGVDKLQVNGSISATPTANGIQQQVNNHRRLYCFYTGNVNQNRLKLTLSGSINYFSFVLNIVYSNIFAADNQSAIREYSFKRVAIANTTNFSEIGTGLGSTVTVISSNVVTGGYEVVLGFNTGGYPQFDIEIVNHQYFSFGTITGEFLTA